MPGGNGELARGLEMVPNMERFEKKVDMSNSWSREEVEAAVADYRDLQALVALNLIKPVGSGRRVKYVPQSTQP